MTNQGALVTLIIDVIQAHVRVPGHPAVTLGSHLYKDLGLTSFDFIQLLDELEDRLGADIDIESLSHAHTVQDVVDALAPLADRLPHPERPAGGRR
ncbi:MAG: acyl carrier protein [Propionibacteriaceae bacterium]|nr:acyl carrier protein [Propionibacteriaceae bacterium]